MKTFRELISWELEQEQKTRARLQVSSDEIAQKLSATVLRKIRHLSPPSADSMKDHGIFGCTGVG